MYLRQQSTICYELSRITTSNLRAFYELFTDCYEYITECNYSSKLLRVNYDLFTCCYEWLRVSYVYLRVLTIFCQKYKSCKYQCIIIRQLTHRESTCHLKETNWSYTTNIYDCSFNYPKYKQYVRIRKVYVSIRKVLVTTRKMLVITRINP